MVLSKAFASSSRLVMVSVRFCSKVSSSEGLTFGSGCVTLLLVTVSPSDWKAFCMLMEGDAVIF
jgi:hypothetical protein